MIIPLTPLILGVLTWLGSKAIPAVWKHRVEKEHQKIELIKDLCDNHNDCEPQRLYVIKGLEKTYEKTHLKYDSKERRENNTSLPRISTPLD